jgi:hypothetical protein
MEKDKQQELNKQIIKVYEENKQRYEKESGYLPDSTLETLRELVYLHRDHPDEISVEYVFKQALLGYYDPMWNGLRQEAGDIIFRLSDFIPREEREKIDVYPSQNGSLSIRGWQYDSLEDWRKQWEEDRGGNIPYFQEQLSPGSLGLE